MSVTIKGIECYGEMYPEQNINIICEDEIWDCIYPDGFNNWTDAVNELTLHFPGIVELEAI